MEAMPRAGQGGDIHFNGCRIFDEVSRELIVTGRRGVESGNFPDDAAPVNLQRVDDGSYRVSQKTALVKTVGDCKGVKRAQVPEVKRSFAFVEFNFDIVFWYCCRPENAVARNTQIIGMWARRAQAVESNQGESASMPASVSSKELSSHKAAVGVETVRLTYTGVQIGSGTRQI